MGTWLPTGSAINVDELVKSPICSLNEHFVKQLDAKIPFYGERFKAKPGITGWAQISYGYGASVADAIEKLNYDLFYIKNMSIFLDIVIILGTIKIVFFSRGAR